MVLTLLALLQHGGGAETAEHAAEKSAEGHNAEPWLLEQANHLLGPTVISVERVILPPIYGLFGAHWHEPAPNEAIPAHVFFAILAFLICTVGLWLFRGKLSVDNPSRRQQLLEMVVIQIRGLLEQVIGPYGRRYIHLVGAFALFILIGNLMGLVPGLEAPTGSINVTGALGITSFVYYISTGFRQQGLGYLKHFTGGLTGAMLPIGILIFFVELISNSVRPVTLSLRLFVNMYADHQIASTFLSLVAPIVPMFTLVLGAFVSIVQTFIFVMLSMVYLSETVPHEEHDVEEHGHPEKLAEAH
ncbi:MAG TPA: F0F1 ATP synthase subunit A [Blastocatellia bacterium]|nr:F0F1 ATP synthase subunit A [Blastocatellia bacterium]